MKVGLLIYGSLETLSGGYLYDRRLVAHLRALGEQVEIVALPWRNYARHLSDNLSAALHRRLEGLAVDVLVQDELNHPSLFWTNRRLRQRAAFPLVAIVHHLRSSEQRPAWQNFFYRAAERLYLASVDGFIFNSQTTRQVVEDLNKQPRPSVVAYPAGDRLRPQVAPDEIARRATEPGPLRLFFLGNLIPRKGLHTLLAALAALPSSDWTLEVAGSLEMDAPYAQAMLRQAAAPGLDGRVHFAGPLHDQDLAARLRASHVLVVPSSYEGFGIAYLEGMGFGLPAIASSGGAAGEIITHGQDGFLIPPGDAAALAGQLAALAGDRRRLLAMGLAAHRRYAAHPTWEAAMEQIRRFLYTLCR